MHYVISDIQGSTVDSFAGPLEARRAFFLLAAEQPHLRNELFLLLYDDQGGPVGDALTVDDLTVELVSEHPNWRRLGATATVRPSSPVAAQMQFAVAAQPRRESTDSVRGPVPA